MRNIQKNKGFSLMELMVAVGIVGVVAAVAYPSFVSATRKTVRAEAKTELNNVAQRLQRCFTTLGKFNDAVNCPVLTELAANGGLGIKTQGKGYYYIALAANPAITTTTYQLNATPVAGSPQVQDTECALFTLNQAGARTAFDSATVPAPRCW
jgi:type IV pilus assembly protein PilE